MGSFEIVFLILMAVFVFAAALDMLGKNCRQTLLDQLGQRLEKLFSRKRNTE